MDAFPTFNIFQVFIEYLLSVMDFLFLEGSWAMPDSHRVLSLLILNKISVKYQVQHFFFLKPDRQSVCGNWPCK